jgi:hypothetical protein
MISARENREMPNRKSKQSHAIDETASSKAAARRSTTTVGSISKVKIDQLKAEQDQLLTEALKESFPASDPISSLRFTS